MRCVCAISLVIFMLQLVGLANVKTLKTTAGEKYTGKLLMVGDEQVLLRTKEGKYTVLDISLLDKASATAVYGWAKSQGGDLDFASWMKTPESSFSKMWPSVVFGQKSVPVMKKHDLCKDGKFVHESQHFRYVSDTDFPLEVLKELAAQCEATRKYCKLLPLNMAVNYYEGNYKCEVHVYKSNNQYHAAGAAGGNVSFNKQYNRCLAHIPFSPSEEDEQAELPMVSEGITRQMLGPQYYGAWYEVGLGMYVAMTPYENGQFRVSNDTREFAKLVKTIAWYDPSGGIIPGNQVELSSLEDLISGEGYNAMKKKAAALLLFHYFSRVADSGRAVGLKNYTKSIQSGKGGSLQLLLNGRTAEEVENEIIKYYRRYGLELSFPSKESSPN